MHTAFKNIKLIVFDLDGTLINAYPAIAKSFNYTMRELGYPDRDALTIRRAVGWGDRNLLKPFISTRNLRKALVIYRGHHRKALLKGAKLFPGVRALLAGLKEGGYKLAIASNRPTEFSLILLHSLRIKEYFDYVLCADKLKYAKPHPQILNKILKRFRLSSSQALYVGDMLLDALTGKQAKIKTIIVLTGSSRRKEIKKGKPCLIISKISDLSRYI